MTPFEPSDDADTLERDEPSSEARAAALIGQTISNRYRIDELLAMGGMGAVYLGEHVLMRKRVAIKILHPRVENLKELVQRFQRAAIAGAHVQHPNVATATDFGQLEDGSYFLILEYVRGVTLHDLIDRGPLSVERTVHIVRQIASALAATHKMGVLHRDVKPSNVMLVDGERDLVKLIDFGLAKIPLAWTSDQSMTDSELARRPVITRKGAMFGTIAYMPPEAALGMDTVDERADLYALGVIFYKLLSGKHPFDASDAVEYLVQHQTVFPPPIGVRTPGVEVPRAVEAVVMRLLKKDVRARFPSADALIAALDAAFPDAMRAPSIPPTDAALPRLVAGAVPPSIPAPAAVDDVPFAIPPAPQAPQGFDPVEAPSVRRGPRSPRLFEWLAVGVGVLLLAALVLAALRSPTADQPARPPESIDAGSQGR